MSNYELFHHGTKGMRWGVRRYQNKDGSLTPAGKKRQLRLANREVKRQRRQDVKERRLLSDADLKKKIDRLKLEKELKTLTNEDVNPGKAATLDMMSGIGKSTISTVGKGATLYAIKAAMTRSFDIVDAAGYVAPKPKKK